MKEIARREGVDGSYVSRMVNLTTTLAPALPPFSAKRCRPR